MMFEHITTEILLERIIRASSNPGDVVMDPFSGTFTASAVAKRLGRRSIGIELHFERSELLQYLNIKTKSASRVA